MEVSKWCVDGHVYKEPKSTVDGFVGERVISRKTYRTGNPIDNFRKDGLPCGIVCPYNTSLSVLFNARSIYCVPVDSCCLANESPYTYPH